MNIDKFQNVKVRLPIADKKKLWFHVNGSTSNEDILVYNALTRINREPTYRYNSNTSKRDIVPFAFSQCRFV